MNVTSSRLRLRSVHDVCLALVQAGRLDNPDPKQHEPTITPHEGLTCYVYKAINHRGHEAYALHCAELVTALAATLVYAPPPPSDIGCSG